VKATVILKRKTRTPKAQSNVHYTFLFVFTAHVIYYALDIFLYRLKVNYIILRSCINEIKALAQNDASNVILFSHIYKTNRSLCSNAKLKGGKGNFRD